MVPQPIVIGLTLCDRILVEEGTKSISLIGCLSKRVVESFPSTPERLCLYAVLTGGLGEATIELVITRLETGRRIASGRRLIRFADRLSRVRLILEMKTISFPAPGSYQFTILLDGEWLTEAVLRVFGKEKQNELPAK